MKYKKLDIIIFFASIGIMLAFSERASAAAYYVSPDGDDTYCSGIEGEDWNNISSPGQPCAWKTIDKVNDFSFQPGDDVYFKSGGTWLRQALWVDWSGVDDANRVVVGAYHMDGGTEIVGVSGNKPIFDGQENFPQHYAYYGLITIDHNNYVTVENIDFHNAGDYSFYGSFCDHVTVRNNEVYNTFNDAFGFNKGYSNIIIENNEVDWCSVGPSWGSCIGLFNESTPAMSENIVVRKNIIKNVYGEGLDIAFRTRNVDVYENVFSNVASASIYVTTNEVEDIFIHHNLIYGTRDGVHQPWTTPEDINYNASGIAVTAEGWEVSNEKWIKDIYIYGNMVALCYDGIMVGSPPNYLVGNVHVYNNTLVGNYNNFSLWMNGNYGEPFYIKNNISWNGDNSQSRHFVANNVDGSHVFFDNNLWSSDPGTSPGNPIARGQNDLSYTTPQIAKTTGWTALTAGSLTGREFALQSDSLAIGAGMDLGDSYDETLDLRTVDFSIGNFPDLLDQDMNGSGWEVGAGVYAEDSATSPGAPGGLAVR